MKPKNWWRWTFFALAVVCDAVMDYFNFQVPYDSGFWSLHTADIVDAWHFTKLFKWTFIVFAIVGREGLKWSIILIYAVLNYVIHETIYHKILKKANRLLCVIGLHDMIWRFDGFYHVVRRKNGGWLIALNENRYPGLCLWFNRFFIPQSVVMIFSKKIKIVLGRL